MKLRATLLACVFSLALGACSNGLRQPLNPPQLIGDEETEMSIQLFMQATILMVKYYGYETLAYETVREKSAKAGFSTLPFMPPEKIKATPGFKKRSLRFAVPKAEGDRPDMQLLIPTALAVDSFWDSQIRESLTRCLLLRDACS